MANEIQASGRTGWTAYALIRQPTNAIYNRNSEAFEAFVSASYAAGYAVSMAEEDGSGHFVANFPSVAAGVYSVKVFRQLGGSPSPSDRLFGEGPIHWDGFAVVPRRPEPMVFGQVSDVSPGASSFKGDSSLSDVDNFYRYRVLAFERGAVLDGVANQITGYTGSTRTFTFSTPWPATPADEDKFIVTGYIAPAT